MTVAQVGVSVIVILAAAMGLLYLAAAHQPAPAPAPCVGKAYLRPDPTGQYPFTCSPDYIT